MKNVIVIITLALLASNASAVCRITKKVEVVCDPIPAPVTCIRSGDVVTCS